MQVFVEFNEKMAAKHFDADAFTMVMDLGGTQLYQIARATNLAFRRATATRPMYVRMDLPENEAGYNRLKLHYVDVDTVDMEFYTFTPLERESLTAGLPDTNAAPLLLLAEHDPQLLQLCQLSLRGSYRLELARDGDEALEKARRLLPDLVVLDLFLPRRDGLQTIAALSEDPQTAHLPVMVISGHKDSGEKVRALGAIDVLARPFEPAELLTRVKASLGRRVLQSATQAPSAAQGGMLDQLGVVTRLEEEMGRASRYHRPLTVAVLKPTTPPKQRAGACAEVVRDQLRNPDVLGHLGNGVLVLILPETALEPARRLTAKLCLLLQAQGIAYAVRLLEVRADQTAAAALESLLA